MKKILRRRVKDSRILRIRMKITSGRGAATARSVDEDDDSEWTVDSGHPVKREEWRASDG